MITVAVIALVWALVSGLVALVVGGCIRIADAHTDYTPEV